MKFESIMILWVVAASILVYFAVDRHRPDMQSTIPLSICCSAEIKYYDNPIINNLCSKCNNLVTGIIN